MNKPSALHVVGRAAGRGAASLAALLALCGCSESAGTTSPGPPAPVPCSVGETSIAGGGCRPAGVQANGCQAGEAAVEGGGCRPAGIPPGGCAPGFEPDDAGGCVATLPPRACDEGAMAVMGETACREVAPCGATSWGDIPTDETTQFVDAAYAGGASDGSAAHPWTTIQEAIDAAQPGALVAVASGSYEEDLSIDAKSVRLWGRCPALVEVVGSESASAAVVVSGGSGTALRDLAVRGAGDGVAVVDADDVVIDRVWLHDLAGRGVTVNGPTASVALTRSLVEGSHGAGVHVEGSSALISDCAIRDIDSAADLTGGQGVAVADDASTGTRGNVSVRGSLIERAHAAAVQFAGSDGEVDGCLMRDVEPEASDGELGRGVRIREGFQTGQRSNVTVTSSVVERCYETGISVGTSDAVLDKTVIRDIFRPPTAELGSFGVSIQNGAIATVTSLLVERTTYVGVAVIGAHATFDAIVVRDSLSDPPLEGGVGFGIQYSAFTGQPATGVLRSSVIERSQGVGVLLASPDAAVEGCLVRDNDVFTDGIGLGIHTQPAGEGVQSRVVLTASVVDRARGTGISLQGADVTMDGCAVRDTRPDPDGPLGVGVHVHWDPFKLARSTVRIDSSVIERSRVAGIDVHAADLILSNSIVRATEPQQQPVEFGDGIVVRHGKDVEPPEPASAEIIGCLIESCARSGISSFGGVVSVGSTVLECNPIALDAELAGGVKASFQDAGDNSCGCAGAVETCTVSSSNIQPPDPPDVNVQ